MPWWQWTHLTWQPVLPYRINYTSLWALQCLNCSVCKSTPEPPNYRINGWCRRLAWWNVHICPIHSLTRNSTLGQLESKIPLRWGQRTLIVMTIRILLVAACLKLKLIYDRQSVGPSVLVSGAHLRPAINFSFSLNFPWDSCEFVIL
jgi:hypothetical protein